MLRGSFSCIYLTLIFSSKCKAYFAFTTVFHTIVMKVSITFISQDIFSLIEGQKVMGILSNRFIGYILV